MSLDARDSVSSTSTTGRRSAARNIAKQSMYDMLSHLDSGQRLPTERELARMFSASRNTVRAVLDELEGARVIARQQGRGTFLRDKALLLEERETEVAEIAVVLPDTSNPMVAQIAEGVRSASHTAGLEARVFNTGLSMPAQIDRLRELRDADIKGLIFYPFGNLVYEREFPGLIRDFVASGTPIVFVDRYLPETDTCYVIPDYFQAAYACVRHLVMLGHRSILHMTMARTGGTTGMIWMRGCRQALQDFGIAFSDDMVRERGRNVSFLEAGYRIIKEFLRNGSHLPFTAITCAQESYAYGAHKALSESGLRVPEDVAIVKSDNVNPAEYDVGWTAASYPWREIGMRAVELIDRQVNAGPPLDERSRHVILPAKLTIRKSCGMHLGVPEEVTADSQASSTFAVNPGEVV